MATQMATQMAKRAQLQEIATYYSILNHQEFTGVYSGVWIEPSYFGRSKIWHTIVPAAKDPVRDKLAAIQHFVQGKVWKGFTNHEDSYKGYLWDYCFYVDLDIAGIQSPDKFKINGYEMFTFKTPSVDFTLNAGIALKVTAIPFFSPPITVQQPIIVTQPF